MSVAEAFRKSWEQQTRKKSISHTHATEKKMKREEEIIANFVMHRDIPPWHRGVSKFQSDAAAKLLNALRDDTEQHTTHRVRNCISLIGLDPLISATETRFLMRLSRGNDLAFLWFLLEVHYKTPGPNYSLNEQLIMSSISHLDMITTLRELDRILPPGHPPLEVIERQRRLELRYHEHQERRAKQKMMRRRVGNNKTKATMPYFKSLPRPKSYGKSLFIGAPNFKVSLGLYEQYKNPRHIVQNELNRWYAQYSLTPGKRIVNRILNDELTNLFEHFSTETLKAERLIPMCGHHKDVLALEESLKNQLRVIARDRCLRLLDVGTKKKEAIRNRVMDQLEREIGTYVCKFHKIARESQRQCRVQILPNACTGYDFKFVNDNGESDNSDESCAPPTPPGLEGQHDSIDVDRDFRRESGGNIFMLSEKKCPPKKTEPCTVGFCTDEGKNDSNDDDESSSEEELKDSGVCNPKQNYNYGHSDASTPTMSQTFFQAPSNNKPYQFDYQKVFRFKSMVKRLNIRKAFVNAINSEAGLNKPARQQQQQKLDEIRHPNVTEAISRCVCRIWKNQVAIKNIDLEAEAERARNLPETINKSPLNYENKLYDPNDRALMEQMLKDAMEYMRKDPKFVLASMPDAHKLIVFKEWIARRYGKMYTLKERLSSYRVSLKIFQALEKLDVHIPTPTTKELGKNILLDYDCHDYLLKKAKKIQKEYYDRLNSVIMEQTRIFWFAMNPYLCALGPPRNTFYAYMPAHITHIKRFRIWKDGEFVDGKGEWEKRIKTARDKAALPQ